MTAGATLRARPRAGSGAAKDRAAPRIALGPAGIVIRDAAFLDRGGEATLHAFLDRAFSVAAVQSVEIDRRRRTARIRTRPTGDLPPLWHQLARALREGGGGDGADGEGEGGPFLGAPGPIRVSRVGGVLSTFRVRIGAGGSVRIGHPLLRQRPDLRFRLEEVLAGLPEIRSFGRDRLTAGIVVRFEPATWAGTGPHRAPLHAAAERLVRRLERAWPQLLAEGPAGRPPARALAISGGILALSATATFLAPELLPVAIAAIIIRRLPNVFAALRDLGRGRVGLPALGATGLAFFLVTRVPLTSSLLATVRSLWPTLAADAAIASQRRLLAPWRRQPSTAWLVLPDGEAVEIPAERLRPGDRIVVRRGETVAADGTIERGLVATADAFAGTVTDREPGDAIRAGARILDGEATLRVARPADRSAAALVAAQLPHGPFARLPALDEAERIANRNVPPTLVLALGTLASGRTLRPARGVIRPDYVTAPAISAQLGAQAAFAEALAAGVLFRHPEALERLAGIEVVVLDDSAPLVTRPLEVARVAASGLPPATLLGLAAVGLGPEAVGAVSLPAAGPVRRRAGCATFHDADGRRIDVVSAAWLRQAGVGAGVGAGAADDPDPPAPGVRRSVHVLRDGAHLGRIDFRDGRPVAAATAVAALRAALGPVRVLLLSGGPRAAADQRAAALGADLGLGGLRPADKARIVRGFDRRTLWIGDGTDASAAEAIAASHVSLSTAAPAEGERADGLLLAGLGSLPGAIAAARRYRAVRAADYRLVYATNLAGTAGALAAGLNGFDVGLLTNAGTAAVYARHRRRLARLERESAARTRAAAADYATRPFADGPAEPANQRDPGPGE